MKKLFTLLILCASLLAGMPAFADLADGVDAYKKGDYETALRELRPLAEKGDADAQVYLGMMYQSGFGVAKDDSKALKWYGLSAEQGNIAADFALWLIDEAKNGFDKGVDAYYKGDYETALNKFSPLAEQGDSSAQFFLGLLYNNGWGVAQDYKEAVKWYTLSAEQGVAEAQDNLGAMYREGKGVPQDYSEAIKWHRLAAEQGLAKAQLNLGVSYNKGEGVVQDYKKAVKWTKLAAEQEDARAQFSLGLMYKMGEGVSQNYKEAAKWWRLSARQEYADAQYSLGLMHYNGDGVVQNYILAHMWWNLATSNGYENGAEARDTVAEKMTSEQIAEAQKMATECQANDYKGC